MILIRDPNQGVNAGVNVKFVHHLNTASACKPEESNSYIALKVQTRRGMGLAFLQGQTRNFPSLPRLTQKVSGKASSSIPEGLSIASQMDQH